MSNKTKKLNKTELHDLIATTVANIIEESTDVFLKGKGDTLNVRLQSKLHELLAPKQGGGSSTKVNDEGEVYCNYFKHYFAPELFNNKLSKPDADGARTKGYKANSILGEQILRKIKTVKASVNAVATYNFQDGTITGEELKAILTSADETFATTFYETVEAVPTVTTLLEIAAGA